MPCQPQPAAGPHEGTRAMPSIPKPLQEKEVSPQSRSSPPPSLHGPAQAVPHAGGGLRHGHAPSCRGMLSGGGADRHPPGHRRRHAGGVDGCCSIACHVPGQSHQTSPCPASSSLSNSPPQKNQVAGTRVRLFGIDAPEKKQACLDGRGESYLCGQAATSALREVIGNAPVACTVKTKDMYRRSVAVCTVVRPGERPLDLNAWLVEEGHAVAYRRYSKDFVPAELRAQEAKRGIWAGRFELPEGWRHKETMPQWFQ